MNRRDLFRNAGLLAAASVVAPDVLAEALPREYSAQIPLEAILAISPAPSPWPTHEEILAELAREYRNVFPYADLSPETADFQILSAFAGAVFANQETARAALTFTTPVATGV